MNAMGTTWASVLLIAALLFFFVGVVEPTIQPLELDLEASLRLNFLASYFELKVPLHLTGSETFESIVSTLAIQFSEVCKQEEPRFVTGWTIDSCIDDLGRQMRTWLNFQSPVQIPAFSPRFISPIPNVYYIEQGVFVDIELNNNGVLEYLPPSAHVCTILHNCVGEEGCSEFRIVKRDCFIYGDGSNVQLPSYRPHVFYGDYGTAGRYKVVVSVNSSANDVAKNEVDFFVNRSSLREEVLSVKAASGTSRPRRLVTVLGIKYGTHGDEAKLSVAVNGKVILDLPLYTLFDIDNESLRSELTQSQQVRPMVSADQYIWFHKHDRARLPDHLALQAATGFVDGCKGLFVTTGGVTAICADATSTRKRWEAAADKVILALKTFLFSVDRNSESNGGEADADRPESFLSPDRDENYQQFQFDAAVFVASNEDIRDTPTSAFNHARAAFQARVWAVQNDCEAFGDAALMPWRNDPDPSSSLSDAYDATPPPLLASVTSDTTPTIRRLLRRLKRGLVANATRCETDIIGRDEGESVDKVNDGTRQKRDELSAPFSFVVARPGYGWDLTLAHRRLISRDEVPASSFELVLMAHDTGVCLGVTSCGDAAEACGTNKEDELEIGQEVGGLKNGGCGEVTDFLDRWIEGLMDADVLAIFSATVGRLSDFGFCATASLASSPLLTPASTSSLFPSKPCLTIDASTLAGVWQITNPDTWWGELKGLRVLVVHPFADTIARQYERNHLKGEALHPRNPNALPLFAELLTFAPAVGTVMDGAASGRTGWRGTVATMEDGLRAYADKFDVALLSCGGWGPVLTHFIRHELGKSAVYLGGSLQLHFGILGGRYNSTPEVHALINEFWTWPAEHETSKLKNNLQGAYASYAYPG